MNFLKSYFFWIKKNEFLYNVYRFLFLTKYLKKEEEVLKSLLEIESFSPKDIRNLQSQKLIELLKYADINTKYYKELFSENNIDITKKEYLKKIPILNKGIIKSHKDDLISKKFWKKNLSIRNTGGSTGEPLEFYCNQMSGHLDNGHHWYLYSKMGYEKGDIIIDSGGIFIPNKLRGKNIYWIKQSQKIVWGEYVFSSLYLNDSNVKFYVDELIKIKPSILRGYPSFFNTLAKYILNNNIEIDFNIKGINLTGELCSELQKLNIEKAFSSMIYLEYGHSEMCLYCYTNDKTYVYKSSPIYGYIEVLDEDGHDVELGQIGRIVATGFNNLGMPFIRYDTGDLGELHYRNGGEVHFKKIVGRNQDFILSKENKKIYLIGLIFGLHLKAFKNIIHWQIKQDIPGEINIYIVKNDSFSKIDENEISYSIKSIVDIDVKFNFVQEISKTKAGKQLFMVQNVKSE